MIEFLIIGLALGIVMVLWKSRMNYIALSSLPQTAIRDELDLTVIIPARNEAHQIARAVGSFPGVTVIVIDDASIDGTAQLAEQAGARVFSAPPLSPGAKGKPNACAEGARQSATRWLLFVDADTWFEPSFTSSLIAYAESNRLQFLTAFLDQRCVTVAEKILLPYAFALYFTGVCSRRVNSPRSTEALANGQCLLCERVAYLAMGGHTAVIDSVIEDVALARQAKAHGLASRVIRAERLGHVRMYDSFVAIWRGFQKNSFRFLLINPWSGIQVLIASILLTSWLPVLVLGLGDYPDFSLAVLLSPTPVMLLFFAPLLALLPWYRGPSVLWAPVAIYAFQLIALNAMLVTLTGRKTCWKGRRV